MELQRIFLQAPYFMLIFIRISAFISFVPFFNNRNYISMAKVTLAFFTSMLLLPVLPVTTWVIPTHFLSFILLVSQEILIGILMGMTFQIFLFGLQLSGRILGFQMAFSMANVMDSNFGDQANVISVLMVLMGTMIVITMGGDHYLLYTLKRSFTILAPGTFAVTKPLLKEISNYFVHAMEIGFKLAAPSVILLLCVDFTLGFIGKTSTKLQIFFVGLPLKICIGLISVPLIMKFVVTVWAGDITRFPQTILRFFRLMKIAQ